MEVLSPRSANVPMKRQTSKKALKPAIKPPTDDKPFNPDRIDDKWKPPMIVTEPGRDPEKYVTGQKLGKGGFAVCFRGRPKNRPEDVALKVVKAHIEQKKMLEKFRTELQIHAKMRHPNIVEFLKAFTFEAHTYVVLELCHNGNLTDMVKARRCLSVPEVRRFMIQICGGVKYMHKRNVIHRDLKMGNIFLDSNMNIKIGDFGLAAVMADEQDRRTTLCGTPNYIAPEILSKSSTRGHDNKVDTWAIGVICYAMLMGTPPFQSKTQQEIYTKLRTLEYEWKIDSKNHITPWAKDFVASCLNLNSVERPEMDDLVEHDFFKCGGVIADELMPVHLRDEPYWLMYSDPRGDATRTDYTGVSHTKICTDSGVGRLSNGKSRPAAGLKSTISTLFEIEAENRQGCAPTVPLPEGVLYQPIAATTAEFSSLEKTIPAQPRSRKTPSDTAKLGLVPRSVSNDEIVVLQPTNLNNNLPTRVLAPSRTIQSFAAQQRQQALPIRAVSRDGMPPPRVVSPIDVPSAEPVEQNKGYLRERPVRVASLRASKKIEAITEAEKDVPNHVKKSSTIPDRLDRVAKSSKGSATAPVPTLRPRTTSSSELKITSRVRSTTTAAAVDTTSDSRSTALTSSLRSAISKRTLRPTSGNDRQPPDARLESSKSITIPPPVSTVPLKEKPSPSQPCWRVIAPNENCPSLPESSNRQTLLSLRSLYKTLSPSAASTRQNQNKGPRSYGDLLRPRVEKWVDYHTRHGIAYILSNGTLGLLLRSNEDNSRPAAAVVLRNCKGHSLRRAKCIEEQAVPQNDPRVEVEFFERQVSNDTSSSEDDTVRSISVPPKDFRLNVKKGGTDPTALALVARVEELRGGEAERLKAIGLLDKFGKYMTKAIDGMDYDSDEDDGTSAPPSAKANDSTDPGLYVEFFQRLGNVGIWGFRDRLGDAGLQFNFPDHTKILVYRNGENNDAWTADIVYLHWEDARDLKDGVVSGLTNDAFERRGMMSRGVVELVAPTGEYVEVREEGIIRGNELREKLAWIRGVVGCWVRNGGVGWMGKQEGMVGWAGLQEKRGGTMTWGTVGKVGGD